MKKEILEYLLAIFGMLNILGIIPMFLMFICELYPILYFVIGIIVLIIFMREVIFNE